MRAVPNVMIGSFHDSTGTAVTREGRVWNGSLEVKQLLCQKLLEMTRSFLRISLSSSSGPAHHGGRRRES